MWLALELGAFDTTFAPGFQPFNNYSTGNQQFAKVTTQVTTKHELTALYQYQTARSTNLGTAESVTP